MLPLEGTLRRGMVNLWLRSRALYLLGAGLRPLRIMVVGFFTGRLAKCDILATVVGTMGQVPRWVWNARGLFSYLIRRANQGTSRRHITTRIKVSYGGTCNSVCVFGPAARRVHAGCGDGGACTGSRFYGTR